jgi:hypothetical protein
LMKLLYEQQHPVSTHWPALMEDYGNVAWSTTVASKSTAFVSERRWLPEIAVKRKNMTRYWQNFDEYHANLVKIDENSSTALQMAGDFDDLCHICYGRNQWHGGVCRCTTRSVCHCWNVLLQNFFQSL